MARLGGWLGIASIPLRLAKVFAAYPRPTARPWLRTGPLMIGSEPVLTLTALVARLRGRWRHHLSSSGG